MLLNNIDNLIQESLAAAASGLGHGLLQLGKGVATHTGKAIANTVTSHGLEHLRQLPGVIRSDQSLSTARSNIATHANTLYQDPNVRRGALGVGLLGAGALALPYVKAGAVAKKAVDYSTEIR